MVAALLMVAASRSWKFYARIVICGQSLRKRKVEEEVNEGGGRVRWSEVEVEGGRVR